jgi:nitrogen fixation protein NifB
MNDLFHGTGSISQHPCFDARAAGRCGRIHLPVAPACNIQCAYCNRAYDCINESRPGVASRVLHPEDALDYLDEALFRMPFITVAGIAGPGDAFADPERTLTTLERIRKAYPALHLCLSTNGLAVPEHVDALVHLRVGFVTVTVNAVDPKIGGRIYTKVSLGKQVLQGSEAASLLVERQMDAIARLKARGITVKVNTVVIPGVNDTHTTAVAKRVAQLKADLHNLIALIPVSGTAFENIAPPSVSSLASLRRASEAFLPQMRHCGRCRADAVGLIHDDRSYWASTQLLHRRRAFGSTLNG